MRFLELDWWIRHDKTRAQQRMRARQMARLAEDIAAQTPSSIVALCVISLVRSDHMESMLAQSQCDITDRAIMQRVNSTLRETDYVVMVSSEEIWIVLSELPGAFMASLAAAGLVAILEPPISHGTVVVTMRPTVGVAIAARSGSTPLNMLKCAANARSHAATIGKRYWVDVTNERGPLNGNDIAAFLQRALKQNALSVHYQPKIDITSGMVRGVEALIRWPASEHLAITPGMLIDAAEQFGLIPELTRFVLNTALREFSTHLFAAGVPTVWVNLSASSVRDPLLPSLLKQMTDVWSVDPGVLGLELTESLLLTDADQSIANLNALVDSGFNLAIDDFGTGYSSLAYLRRLPLRELKIDQLFVRNMVKSLADQQIVRTIIDLAHNFQLTVVAEGVEDDAILAMLREMGCDQVQGYVFTRALPAEELVSWISNRDASTGAAG